MRVDSSTDGDAKSDGDENTAGASFVGQLTIAVVQWLRDTWSHMVNGASSAASCPPKVL